MTYDPSAVRVVEGGRFRYHFLPGRERRPGARSAPAPEGLFRPHRPCPFDGEEFLREREVLRLARSDRLYHVAQNRFPVEALHFIAIRPDREPPATLPQYLQNPDEIEDMLASLRAVGRPYRVYFNSNPGADDSRSGSSVNHWHFQFFAYPRERTPLEETLERSRTAWRDLSGALSGQRSGRVRGGAAPGWPAVHLLLESEDEGALARALWTSVERVNRKNVAYNVEARELPGGRLRALLFPRRPAPPAEIPEAGSLPESFGGCEMSGDIVLTDETLLEWHAERPERAERLTESRLRETTRGIDW